MKRSLVIPLIIFCVFTRVYPNGGPMDGSNYERTGTIIPLRQNAVTLKEEQLRVKLHEDSAIVDVTYLLENGQNGMTIAFAFPIDISEEGAELLGNQNRIAYKIFDGSTPLRYTRKNDTSPQSVVISADNTLSCTRYWHLSELTFKAAEKKRIVIQYRVPCSFRDWITSKSVLPAFGNRRFLYGFSFAKGWAGGMIEKLSISVDASAITVAGATMIRTRPYELAKRGGIYELAMKNVHIESLEDLMFEYDVSESKMQDFFKRHAADKSKMSITASSQLKGDYSPRNTLDGNKKTVWAEGVPGRGENEWIEIRLNGAKISYLGMLNGVILSEELYKANARIASLKVECYAQDENGEHILNWVTRTDDGIIQIKNQEFKEAQQPIPLIDFGDVVPQLTITRIRLTILSTYPGNKFDDCCITDFVILKP